MPRPAPDLPDAHLPALRAQVRADAENRPGIYRMLAADGEVLYVGKSKSVRTRLLSYFRCAYPEEKGARIIREAAHLEWDYAPSEFAALLLELKEIKRWRPRFNVQMKRDAQHWSFIKIARGPAPKLLVVRGGASEEGGVWYGPFHGARRVAEAVRELNDALGLRDCALGTPMRFADQRELFPDALVQITPRTLRCIRHEIRKCLGPCVAGCTHEEYRERVVLARAFLDGADDGPLERLRADMLGAAEQLQFERAASLRDKVRRLEGLQEQFARLRYAVEELSFVYTVPGYGDEDRVYLVRRGRVRAEMRAPRRAREHARLRELVRSVFAPVERASAAVPTHEVEELLLLSSWFRRFPDELARTQAPDMGAVVVDPLFDDEPAAEAHDAAGAAA